MLHPVSLRLLQSNDETLHAVVYLDTRPPRTTRRDISDITAITLLIKASPQTPDADATTLTLAGGHITVTDAERGELTIEVPASVLAVAGERWFRLDLAAGARTRTVAAGYLQTADT